MRNQIAKKKIIQMSQQLREELKQLPIYDGRYLVSNEGNVYSNNYKGTGERKKLSLVLGKDGYVRITLYLNSYKKKTFTVHRLVAMVFIKNPSRKTIVHHIDENKSNNHVCNLAWIDKSSNAIASSYKWQGEKHGRTKITNQTALKIRQMRSEGILCKDIASLTGININTIFNISNGKSFKKI